MTKHVVVVVSLRWPFVLMLNWFLQAVCLRLIDNCLDGECVTKIGELLAHAAEHRL